MRSIKTNQRRTLIALCAAAFFVQSATMRAEEDFGCQGMTRMQLDRFLPLTKPHPFEDGDLHVVKQLNGEKEPLSLPAEIQWISKSWNREDARCPYLAYMPEKNKLLMIVLSNLGKTSLISSEDNGKTWSPRRWLDVNGDGRPDSRSLLGLTYLGRGKLICFSEDLNTFCVSSDYGETWTESAQKTSAHGTYAWDPLLPTFNSAGEIDRLSQGCWKPTGIPWGSADGPYSQGYFRYSADLGRSWSEPDKVPQWLGVNEINLIVAKNGDWIAACRTDVPGRFAATKIDNYGGLGISVSKDEGKTWSEVKMLYEWGRHHPSMVLLPDGRIVMSYVARLGYPNNTQGFPQFGIEAMVSRDNGQTWDMDHRYVLAAWVGNIKVPHLRYWCSAQSTTSVLLPDGMILTAFGTGFIITEEGVAKDIKDVALVRWRIDSLPANPK